MHIFPQEGFAAARLRRATLLLSAALLSFSGPAQAQLLWDADGVPGGSIGGTGNWNTTDAFWDDSGTMTTWDNAANSVAQFGGTAGTVTVTTGITVNRLVFDVSGYLVTGNALTLAGTAPTITTDADATVASNLSGATLRKNGSGALTTTGDITLTGGWDLDSGTTNIQGAANVTAGTDKPLRIGEAAGSRAVLKINTTGTVSLGASVASAYAAVGGNGSGAMYHDAGRMEIGTANNFSYLGVGRGTNSYGYYRMVGGELIEGPGNGRLGANIADGSGSIGVLDQMGGTLTFDRYIVINNAGGSSFGQMTLTG
jgi:fibronectin-binding autotransporter adhesin